MKIRIKLFERAVDVSTQEGDQLISSGTVPELLSLAKKYGRMIDRVEIEGDCQSYTFKRQVFLFVNLINYCSGDKKQVFPKYQYDQKTSS